MDKFNKGKARKQNIVYTKLIRDNQLKNKLDREQTLKQIYENQINIRKGDDDSFRRLRYVRYANDFLVSIIGTKQEALEIKDQLQLFLKQTLMLDLSLSNIKITHASTDRAYFLGVEIFMMPNDKRQIKRIERKGIIQMNAPISKILEKLYLCGFLSAKLSPTRVGNFIHYDILYILEIFKFLVRGLLNYYAFTSNFTRFKASILYVLKYSFVLTIASKLKLKTKKQVFKKYGKSLSFKNEDGTICKFEDESLFLLKSKRDFNKSNYDPESIIDLAVKKVR